jgi:alkanesulfonate monooxygenase SsuD/methylene tetrahydromethanopterin reductase-like flavin-dependent oxidoreductase (luciferase family)
MKFGVFDQNDRSGLPLTVQYENRLALAELYDRLGFHCFHMSEHHGTSLTSERLGLSTISPARAIETASSFGTPVMRIRTHIGYVRFHSYRTSPMPLSTSHKCESR